REGPDRSGGETVPVCCLRLPNPPGQCPRRGRRSRAVLPYPSAVAAVVVREGGRGAVPPEMGRQCRAGVEWLPRVSDGRPASGRARSTGAPAHPGPRGRVEVPRRGGREGPAPLRGDRRRCARSGRPPARAGLALPAVPQVLRAVPRRVAPVVVHLGTAAATAAPPPSPSSSPRTAPCSR